MNASIRWATPWLLASSLASAAACFNPSYDQARCGPLDACPSGTTCDGEVCVAPPDGPPATPGALRWARSMSMMAPVGIVENAAGLVVSGYVSAPIDLGAGVITPNGTDTVLAGFAPSDASYLYANRFGGAGGEYGFLSTTSLDGVPFVHGVSYGDADLGLGDVMGGGGPGADGFVGRYGSAVPAWVKRLVGPGEDKLVGTAQVAGSLYVLGWFEGRTSFEDLSMTSLAGSRDIFFAKLDPATGATDVTRVLGSADRDEGTSIVAAPAGDALFASGFFAGTLALGGAAPTLTSSVDVDGGPSLDAWVAKLSLAGDPQWAVRFGGLGDDRPSSLITDASGDLYLTGTFSDQLVMGTVTLIARGDSDVFVAKLRGGDGAVVWATSFGSTAADSSGALALDGAGTVLLTATVAGELEPGGPFAGGLDACLAAYDADGTRRWVKVLGTADDDRGWAVHGDATSGYFGVSVATALPDLGVPVIGAPSYTGLLLKIVP